MHRPPPPSSRAGFSLAELMVAMVVLTLLGMMIAEMIGLVGRLTNASRKPMDATYEARIAFDRIAGDIFGIFQRTDMVYVFKNVTPGEATSDDPNDSTFTTAANTRDLMRFITQVQAPDVTGAKDAENRGISIVAYRMSEDQVTHKPVLERGARAIYWNALGSGGSTGKGDTFYGMQSSGLGPDAYFYPVPLPTVEADELWSVIANGVFRIELGFQLGKDYADPSGKKFASGTVLSSPPVREWTLNSTGTKQKAVDITKIGSIVVAIGVVDRRTWEEATIEELQQLGKALPPLPGIPSGYGEVPLDLWLPVARGSIPFKEVNGIPAPIRNAARVYQRFFTVKQ